MKTSIREKLNITSALGAASIKNPLTDTYIHEPDGLTYLARKVQMARQFAERPIRKQSEDPSNRPPRGKRK